MKNKIIGIFVCMLLISSTTTLALTPFSRDEQQTQNQMFNMIREPLPTPKGWIKTFGGSDDDEGYFVQQTMDGGYIIVGYTWSFGVVGSDVWLIKTDANGNEVWNKTLGGEWAYSGQQTTDGGYIITGFAFSFDAGSNVCLIKTNSYGEKEWDKRFGGPGSDGGTFVRQTADGGYIITGVTESFDSGAGDVWLIKTNDDGDMMWNKTLGGIENDIGWSVDLTTDGGYIIQGETISSGENGRDILLIKTDANGNQVWNRTFGGTGWDEGFSVQQTTDGQYIITGWTESFGAGGGDVWLIKIDIFGDLVWDKTFGGTGGDIGYSVQQTTDDGYIIVGAKSILGDYGWDSDVWLIKTNNEGYKEWDRTFGGTYSDYGRSVQQTTDGGYIIVGYTWSFGAGSNDIWLIKTNSEGKFRTTSFDNMWFEQLFQQFPNAFIQLRQLKGY